MDLELRLEVVILPVSDVDATKAFYEKAGFVTDTDHRAGEHFRVVQLTPPGSACSVTFGVGMPQGGPRVRSRDSTWSRPTCRPPARR